MKLDLSYSFCSKSIQRSNTLMSEFKLSFYTAKETIIRVKTACKLRGVALQIMSQTGE